MYAFVFLAALPGQFVDNPQFSKAQQQVAYEATARIYHDSSRSAGTAVVIARKDGKVYLLTAAHLVPNKAEPGREQNIRNVEIHLYNATNSDKVTHADALIVARMPDRDIAVLEVLETKLANPPTAVPLCPLQERDLKTPFAAMTIGANDGPPEIVVDQVKRKPVVNVPNRGEALYWEADIPQVMGRSGGPMIDSRGYVIGIASGTQHGKGYYVSIDEIRSSLRNEGLAWLYEKPGSKK
jgi:S1-C subfamily serine protease